MLLTVDRVNAYYGKSHVLRDVSLEVDTGEVVALLGRNGSGRSTTLKTIMGVVPPKTGIIRLHDQCIERKTPFALAQHGIAFVPEDRRIFPNLTVAENLRLAALRGRKGPWNEKRIYDYFAVLGERRNSLARLSGGEQQMLAIARALIANPEIILLDEPMEGLAPLVARAVEDVVRNIKNEGATILLVEQNVHVAMSLSDRGYVLSNGRVMASGPSATLQADQTLMQRYLAV
ncbi:MAG: ABC transporter ATP-binding protein [Candidatus Eremiobacteraeota bacterium]|nr:ABC transporter ATP-binding protein [Candidatus Eremiobacteraeota bacterium]MBV8353783.1 ABC transporter ATP-binding protein [Candidatus Eremiobacteraeota bacterium]